MTRMLSAPFADSVPRTPGAQGVHRVASVLRLLARHPAGLRYTEIAASCGWEKPTAHRLLKALADEQLVVRDPTTRRYQIGALIAELGLLAAPQFNMADVCRPALDRLASDSGDTAFLFVRRGYDAHCVAREQGSFPIQTPVVAEGSLQPLGVNAGGLAMLAAASDAEVKDILGMVEPRLAAYGELTREALMSGITVARLQGYACIGEHAAPGVTAVGLALRNRHGTPVAGLAIASTTARMGVARQLELKTLLEREVQLLAPVFER